jgi:hypothetical protein
VKTLEALVEKALAAHPGDDVCLLGDLVDRGPDSRGVVELAISEGWLAVMGNHERMMLDGLSGGIEDAQLWFMNGGRSTMESYAAYPLDLLARHKVWLKGLPAAIIDQEGRDAQGRILVASHAGLQLYCDDVGAFHYEAALELAKRDQSILWHRNEIHPYTGIFQVVGHTPKKDGPILYDHCAYIDSGAYAARKGYGYLTALHWPSMTIHTQPNVDDQVERRSREVSP